MIAHRSPPRVLFATYKKHPQLEPDDEVLAAALLRRGIRVEGRPWDLIDPHQVDGPIVLRSTWDYHLQPKRFADWLSALSTAPTLVFNAPSIGLWNIDKAYLAALEERGVAVPRTIYLEPDNVESWPDAVRQLGTNRSVVKPAISATAYGTHVVSAETRIDDAALAVFRSVGALCQEFLPDVSAVGEMSLVFIGGHYSHAALKRPRAGEFRVQREFGGTAERVHPPTGTIAFAARALACAPSVPTFARVDLVQTVDRGPVLMELELLEPSLFWALAPEGAERLATMIFEALRGR